MFNVNEFAIELERVYKEHLLRRFPYADLRKLVKGQERQFEGLFSDLDMYFYGIASPCGAARKVLKLPAETLLEIRKELRKSFFERHPRYVPLQQHITPANTPYLYQEMAVHEEARMKVLELVRRLLDGETV